MGTLADAVDAFSVDAGLIEVVAEADFHAACAGKALPNIGATLK